MKCENCGVLVKSEFVFAIQKNMCPACGKSIMQKEKLAVYVDLQKLLRDNTPDGTDIDKIAALLVSKFNISRFSVVGENKKLESVEESSEVTEEVEEGDDEMDAASVITSDGVLLQAPDNKKNKAILQRLRDEALSGAMQDKYGFESDDEMLTPAKANQEVTFLKQKEAQDKVAGGTGGAFRRG